LKDASRENHSLLFRRSGDGSQEKGKEKGDQEGKEEGSQEKGRKEGSQEKGRKEKGKEKKEVVGLYLIEVALQKGPPNGGPFYLSSISENNEL
jgi:hypothetical protein